MRDCYSDLGITDYTVSTSVINAAYRKLAPTCHPDRNPGDSTAQERFNTLKAALDTLSNDNKRFIHDLGLLAQKSPLGISNFISVLLPVIGITRGMMQQFEKAEGKDSFGPAAISLTGQPTALMSMGIRMQLNALTALENNPFMQLMMPSRYRQASTSIAPPSKFGGLLAARAA